MNIKISLFKAAQSAPVTNVGLRTLLTLVVIAIILLSVYGMFRGWRKKFKANLAPIQNDIPAGANAISPKVAARFAGTTTANNWLDRITNYELGTPRGIDFQVFDQGIYFTDTQEFKLWISKEQISQVRTGRGIAGDVVEKDGMLIFTWQLGETLLDTGVRVSRHADHELIVTALNSFPNAGTLPKNADTGIDMGAGA